MRLKQYGWWLSARGLALALVMFAGCGAREFHADGALTSEGGNLGTWSWRPQGCLRASANKVSTRDAKKIASLLWIDPVRRDPARAGGQQFARLDAPVRLDLVRSGEEVTAVLETVKTLGTEFNRGNCATLTLMTHEERPTLREGRPALGGTLRMDCEVRGSHVTADVRFTGCDD